MRKVGIGCLVLTAVAIIALVISHVVSSRAKDELVQQEVESVVKFLMTLLRLAIQAPCKWTQVKIPLQFLQTTKR